ncbi:hypothetical protein COLO4_05809 [Corchorus olitorius]|uniref:Reverse transcriptase n=1 Tax=Corchorus olitorius TaxID=93759 RepID=A0A1R3KPS3_9ROSI|nr:hypothetical protein COLO4_05809 [Corchorus olitorius]
MSESVEGSGGDGEDKNLLGRMSALESKLESMMGLLKQSMQVRDVVEPAKAESAAQSMAEQRVIEPFKMEVRIEIPIYDGELNPEKLHLVGILQLWARSRKDAPHPNLAGIHCCHQESVYPLGYEEELRGKWQFLRQKKGQTVQEYTTEFRKQAMLIGVNFRGAETLAKYKAGLHYSLRTELALFNVKDLDDASIKAMHMEKQAKPFRDQQGSRKEAESSVEKGKKADKKNASATRREEKTCEHCSKTGHTKDRCWELHPEKKPKNWKGKRTAVARHDHTGKEEGIEGSEYPDEKLVCMAYRAKQKHCSTASASSDTGKVVARAPDSVKEELFWIYVQIQMSKHKDIIWGTAENKAFSLLKQRISTAPALAMPDLRQPFEIETDASGHAMGAVLLQGGKPVCYHSQLFSGAVLNYPTYDKELFVVVLAIRKWRHYLTGKETIFHTDHEPLKYLHSQSKLRQSRHFKWMGFLEQFHLLIRYKKGKTNQLADWLSRPPLKVANMVMYREPSNSVIYKEQYIEDTCFQNAYQQLEAGNNMDGYHLEDGLLFKGGKLCVPSESRLKLIREAHHSLVAGHFGIHKTVANLQRYVYWPNMLNDVTHYIRGCSICSVMETETGGDIQESVALKFVQKIQLVHKQVEEQLIKAQAKYKERHDKHRVDHSFQVGDMVWLYLGKDRMKGRHMKLKPIRYGPFKIIEQYGTNAFKLDLPSYMHMYSVVNVDNLRLFEPSLLDERDDTTLLPVVHDLVPMERATTDMLLDRKTRKTRNGEQEFYWVCPKGQYPNRAKRYSQEQMQEKFLQLLIDAFEGPKASLSGRSDP